jgi:aminoglycoside phosphotransferase (APT) family kinase protein
MITENDSPKKEIEAAKEMARLVIKHHFGTRPARIEFKASGLSNFVFAVKHAEGEFVVRISPDPARINTFIKEQWTQAKAAEAGVPTAEILEVGMEVIPQPFMITRTVKGRDAVYHPRRNEIVRSMGRYAAQINSIRTSGFGSSFDWSNNQLSRHESWKDYLEKELDYEGRLKVLVKRRMISDKQHKALDRIFAAALKLKPRPVLNHGDVRLKNVIVNDDGEIQAFLDWEHSSSNLAPHWELALALHDLSIDEKQHFLEGYGLNEKKIAEAAPLMKAFNLINYTGEVERLAAEKDNVRLGQYRTRLSGALDLFSLGD